MGDEAKYRLWLRGIDGSFTLGRTCIWAAVLYALIYYGHLVGVAFAGTTTEANLVISLLANLQADRWFAYLLGAGGIWYGRRQRTLRQRTIRRLTEHTAELEGRMDSERTSSGLTSTGKTRVEDRG